jgi:methylglutaconyl-CoA hydratase
MTSPTTLLIEKTNGTTTIWLNRPEIHNAFNEVMINELLHCFIELNEDESTKVILLRGKGKSFCAGADLNWMRDVANYSYDQNYLESLNLSKCFHAIYTSKKPTIAVVHGAAIGGANGLLAACDFAYCEENTTFSLSEVKIGIIPACISPYVNKRVGEYTSKELMLTGKRFNGPEALHHRLVNGSFSNDNLMLEITKVIDQLLTSGPKAMSHCKELLFQLNNHWTLEDAVPKTAEIIADIRQSSEGQEGMAAFLEKRKPNWITKQQ